MPHELNEDIVRSIKHPDRIHICIADDDDSIEDVTIRGFVFVT